MVAVAIRHSLLYSVIFIINIIIIIINIIFLY